MNTTVVENVITELPDDYPPAEVLTAWAERPSDVD